MISFVKTQIQIFFLNLHVKAKIQINLLDFSCQNTDAKEFIWFYLLYQKFQLNFLDFYCQKATCKYWLGWFPLGHIFCTEIKILNSGSHDISQKLRQTKCILFKIWRLKCTIILKKSHLALGNLAKLVFWSILSFKNGKVNT